MAYGARLHQGVPLAADVTMVSSLRSNGQPYPRAASVDGVRLAAARRRKEARYPEVIASARAHLLVLACETGGRWDREALEVVRVLAQAKADGAPAVLRRSAQLAWSRRWLGMVSVAAQRSFAASLITPRAPQSFLCADYTPEHMDVLTLDPVAPTPSRLPAS